MNYIINYNEQGKILGFTQGKTDLNIEVTNAIWFEAQKFNKIIIDGDNITFHKVDWRAESEILEQAKAEKLTRIESDFNLAESQSVSYFGFEFIGGQESVKSIDDYYRLMLLAGETSFTIWDVNKEDHILTEAEVKGLIIAIGSVSSTNQFNLKNRKVALANATTLAEVEAV